MNFWTGYNSHIPICGQYSIEKYSGMLANGNAKYKVKKIETVTYCYQVHTRFTLHTCKKKGGNGKKIET